MPRTPYEPLKIAFIGGALNSAVGYTHFNASRLDGHFRVDAGCFSRDQKQNEATARTYGVESNRCYPTWEELLIKEKREIDAIVILTPTPSHLDIVKSSITAGYPVICEKALGIDSAECLDIANTVSNHKGYLAITYNYSGYPMVRELRRMITEGKFGKLQQIHIEMPQEGFLRANTNPQKWRCQDYGIPTVSLDLGVHVHHLIDFISNGAKPVSIVGDQATYGHFSEIIDNVYLISKYENNIHIQAWWGKTALGHRNGLRLRLFGEKGSAEWYQMNPEVLQWADDEGRHYSFDRGSNLALLANEPRYNRFKAGHPSGFIEAFANLYADIAEEIRGHVNGQSVKNSYVFGVQHAIDGMKFIEAVNNSAKTKKWVAI
jgi:predicted dehydrogenase